MWPTERFPFRYGMLWFIDMKSIKSIFSHGEKSNDKERVSGNQKPRITHLSPKKKKETRLACFDVSMCIRVEQI